LLGDVVGWVDWFEGDVLVLCCLCLCVVGDGGDLVVVGCWSGEVDGYLVIFGGVVFVCCFDVCCGGFVVVGVVGVGG